VGSSRFVIRLVYQHPIAAEHGVDLQKIHELVRTKQPEALMLMRSLKATLDPKGILNPGKVL
jgi:FAD/FMN-containing dehydrogenase